MLKRGRKGRHCKSPLGGTDDDPDERYPSGGRNTAPRRGHSAGTGAI